MPFCSWLLVSWFPAASRARTTKYALPWEGRPGVRKLVTLGGVVDVGCVESSPPCSASRAAPSERAGLNVKPLKNAVALASWPATVPGAVLLRTKPWR
jgi:hypothetical protein